MCILSVRSLFKRETDREVGFSFVYPRGLTSPKSTKVSFSSKNYDFFHRPITPAKKFKLPSSLNGSSGEWTNSDDVNPKDPKFSISLSDKAMNNLRDNNARFTVNARVATKNNVSKRKTLKFQGKPKDTMLSAYEACLTDGFLEASQGARVPDMDSTPTVTFSAGGTMTIVSGSNSLIDMYIQPNPLVSTILLNGAVNGSGQSNYSTSTAAFAATTLSNLETQFSSVRVVGATWKIRNLLVPTAATGRVIVAPVVSSGSGVSNQFISTGSGVTGPTLLNSYTGMNVTSFTSEILAFPGAQECTMQDLISSEVKLNTKPISPAAFLFHNTSPNGALNQAVSQSEGSIVDYTNATGTSFNVSNIDAQNYSGFQAFIIHAEGIPATTATFDLEYIFHYEGVPALVSGSGNLNPVCYPKTHIDLNGFNRVLSKVLPKPCISIVSSLIGAGNGIYKAANSKSGQFLMNAIAKLGMMA